MAIQTLHEMFQYELREALAMEQQLAELLATLLQEVQNDQLKQMLRDDAKEGQEQAQRLDNCLSQLGVQPTAITCEGVQGFKKEFEEFKRRLPSPELLDAFIQGTAFKADYYEIATYMGLIEKSMLLGQHPITQLLEQSLEEEQECARNLQKLGQQMGKQMKKQNSGLRA